MWHGSCMPSKYRASMAMAWILHAKQVSCQYGVGMHIARLAGWHGSCMPSKYRANVVSMHIID